MKYTCNFCKTIGKKKPNQCTLDVSGNKTPDRCVDDGTYVDWIKVEAIKK